MRFLLPLLLLSLPTMAQPAKPFPPPFQKFIDWDAKQKADAGAKTPHPIYGLHDGQRSFAGPLLPVGYSDDGQHFAYFDHLSSGGCFCTGFNIVDLVDDTQLMRVVGVDESLTEFIKTRWTEIAKGMRQHRIKGKGALHIRSFPAVVGDKTYSATIKTTAHKRPPDCAVKETYEVVFSDGRDSKTIKTSQVDCDLFYARHKNVVGYVPTRNRVAVVVMTEGNGFEGELTRQYYVAGASLKFSKPRKVQKPPGILALSIEQRVATYEQTGEDLSSAGLTILCRPGKESCDGGKDKYLRCIAACKRFWQILDQKKPAASPKGQ